MPHRLWCGKSCADCESPCLLDSEIPCSPDCELLNSDGTRQESVCIKSQCDACNKQKR